MAQQYESFLDNLIRKPKSLPTFPKQTKSARGQMELFDEPVDQQTRQDETESVTAEGRTHD